MPDQTQSILPPPEAPLPVPVTHPTTAQVLSAAVQNVAAIAALAAGWFSGKLDSTVAVIAILLVVGIDFAGRRRLPGNSTAVVAVGATSVFSAVSGFSGLVLAALAALGMAGCGADLSAVKHTFDDLRHAYDQVCSEPVHDAVHSLDEDAGVP